jgi:hypothetical protein
MFAQDHEFLLKGVHALLPEARVICMVQVDGGKSGSSLFSAMDLSEINKKYGISITLVPIDKNIIGKPTDTNISVFRSKLNLHINDYESIIIYEDETFGVRSRYTQLILNTAASRKIPVIILGEEKKFASKEWLGMNVLFIFDSANKESPITIVSGVAKKFEGLEIYQERLKELSAAK